jgi:hypothetical protein
MNNVTFVIVEDLEHAIIAHEDGSFTSMPKSTYDAMQAEQSTPMVTDEAASL